MAKLQEALTLLQDRLGKLDNIKLMLGPTDGKNSEDVEAEILRLAKGIHSGEYPVKTTIGETALKQAKIAI